MAKLPILTFPDTRLRTVAKPVERIDQGVRQLIDDMFETMYAADGVGLAATQVNRHVRVVVTDTTPNRPLNGARGADARVYVNPNIEVLDETPYSYEEGCLSVPGYTCEVRRPVRVRVTSLDEHGKPFVLEEEGLPAVCIQHECDHLRGRLFIDYAPPSVRRRLRLEHERKQRELRRMR